MVEEGAYVRLLLCEMTDEWCLIVKKGAYVIQELREMPDDWCLIVEEKGLRHTTIARNNG